MRAQKGRGAEDVLPWKPGSVYCWLPLFGECQVSLQGGGPWLLALTAHWDPLVLASTDT
jgi:hypothetical protein